MNGFRWAEGGVELGEVARTGWKWGKPGRGGAGGPTLELCQARPAGCLL